MIPNIPSYRCHKPSGQAVVTLNGKDFYLGPWKSALSRTAYDRLIAEWVSNGRQLPNVVACGERVARFWSDALDRRNRDYSDALNEIDWLVGILRVHRQEPNLPKDSRLIGAATTQQVEDLFHPKSIQVTERSNRNGRTSSRRGSGAGASRLFHGHGWGETLVLPFYDFPGRVSGFLFVGRNADVKAGDVVYKAVNRGPSNRSLKEAGIAMAPTLTGAPQGLLGGSVFLLADPLTALRVQCKSLLSNNHFLPVGGLWADAKHQTQAFDTGLIPSQPIVWAPVAGWELLALASRADGLIAAGAPLGDAECRHSNAVN